MRGSATETVVGIGRGIGVTDLVHGQAPWIAILVFALLTQLGDVWFLLLLGGVFYVGGGVLPGVGVERKEGLFVVALVVTYLALIGVLKDLLLLPRPPGAAEPPPLRWVPSTFAGPFGSITTATGSGFPSGHALGTTMGWTGLALVVDRGRLRTRVGIARTVVALVSVSRLVLGVHYIVDVLAGVLLGVVVLGGLYVLADYGADPEPVLLVAGATGVVGLVVDPAFDSVATVGAAVGAWVVWRTVAETTPVRPTTTGEVLVATVVALLAAAIVVAVYVLGLPHPVTFLGVAVAAGTTVIAPLLGERLT